MSEPQFLHNNKQEDTESDQAASLDLDAKSQTVFDSLHPKEWLELALDAADIGAWELNLVTLENRWSKKVEELYGYAPGTYDSTLEGFYSRVHVDDREMLRVKDEEAPRTGIFEAEFRIVLPDGAIRWIAAKAKVFYDRSGNPRYMSGVDRDITSKKLTEIALQEREERYRRLLEEKELLLREVHHRVKNNLQLICSLLNLQASYIQEAEIKDVLQESQHRIRAMAAIHESLYQSENLTRIDFSLYINQLRNDWLVSYNTDFCSIDIQSNIEAVFLSIDLAVPCGLIINELVSNALKHAFSGRQTGEIHIDFKSDSQKYQLIVSDNGIGLPESISLSDRKTLGLRLVNGLIRQLHGTVELSRSNGTRYKITFSLPNHQTVDLQ